MIYLLIHSANLEWDKRDSENLPSYPRYGHTGILYQKKYIVYGGKIKSITYHLMGDLDIYDLNENTWSTPGFSSKNFLAPRRNHIAELIGHQIFIHGGLSEDNEVLGDCHVLSLNPYKWITAAINELTPSPHLTGHASTLVVPSDLKYNARMNIYKYPEVGFGKLYANKVKKFLHLFLLNLLYTYYNIYSFCYSFFYSYIYLFIYLNFYLILIYIKKAKRKRSLSIWRN